MLISTLYLLMGLVLLVYSADKFIMGAATTAKLLGVSTMMVGLIVIGFGTSAPEMVVSAIASMKGNPGIALGNAVGSNITNIALVLGIGLIIAPMAVKSQVVKREMPILIVASMLTFVLLFDLELDTVDGVILIVAMGVVTVLLGVLGLREGKDVLRDEIEAELNTEMSLKVALAWLVFGIIMLPVASQLMVTSATDIAKHFGVSDLIIGLTIVALGTSLPELAATIASVLKKEHDLAIGNIVGSNIFNLLGVIGISGLIANNTFSADFIRFDYIYMMLLIVFLQLVSVYFVVKDRFISRIIGIILLSLYVGYMIWLYIKIE